MATSYVQRIINLSFQLGQGSFGGSGANQLTLKGLRIIAQIDNAGLPTPGATALIRVFGMTLDQMNQLSVAGLLWNNRENRVRVEAGDSQSGLAEVFNGNILEAYPDFKQPECAFVVRAIPGVGLQLKPVQPSTFQGSTDGIQALESIVKLAGLTLENNGVSGKLVNPYFPGTVWEQVIRCVRSLDCFAYYDSTSKKIAIWPKNKARNGSVRLIAPETGMIDYPQFQNVQVKVRTLLDTSIKFGTKFRVKSGLAAADGEWNITHITQDIASEMPDGPWEMTITGNRDQGSGSAPTSSPPSSGVPGGAPT